MRRALAFVVSGLLGIAAFPVLGAQAADRPVLRASFSSACAGNQNPPRISAASTISVSTLGLEPSSARYYVVGTMTIQRAALFGWTTVARKRASTSPTSGPFPWLQLNPAASTVDGEHRVILDVRLKRERRGTDRTVDRVVAERTVAC